MEAYQETSLLKSSALRQLSKFLHARRQAWAHSTPDLGAFERKLHAHLLAFERELMAEELAQYDIVAEHITVNGVVYSQAMEATERYMTSAGKVVVKRHVYRPAGRSTRHICPLELQGGSSKVSLPRWPHGKQLTSWRTCHRSRARRCWPSWAICNLTCGKVANRRQMSHFSRSRLHGRET